MLILIEETILFILRTFIFLINLNKISGQCKYTAWWNSLFMHHLFCYTCNYFFVLICGFIIYLQYINEDWKYLVPKPILPDSCNDNTDIEFVIHKSDNIVNRSFKDEPDTIDGNQIHTIFLLPCERV